MTPPDEQMLTAVWRAMDLTRAYLTEDRAQVAECLTGVDSSDLEGVMAWVGLEYDAHFDALGEPMMSVRELDAAAALTPPETELAVTTAVRRVAKGKAGLIEAVADLELLDQVHAIAICTTVMLCEAHGRPEALRQFDAQAASYQQMGYPRPRTA